MNAAPIYKWVDDAGNVTYSQRQPPPDVERETIQPAPGQVDSVEAVRQLQQRIEYLDGLQQQRRHQAGQSEAEAESMRVKAAACENAGRRQASLQNPRISQVDAAGNRRRMGEEERLAALQKTREYLQENCR